MNPQAPQDGSSPGTVTNDSAVLDAIASAAARPQAPLADVADQIYERKVETPSEPAKPTKEPETPKETPAPATSQGSEETEVDDEEGGYFADAGLDDFDEPASGQPLQGDVTLSALEQYIAKNIGAPLNVRIKVGNSVKTIQAYSPENLPEGYEFATDHDRTTAQLGFDALTRKAEQLQSQFLQEENQKAAEDFSSQEDRAIQLDIASLQRQKQGGKDGLDLFKYAPDDPRFDNDPAVKEMQAVLDFYNEENQNRYRQNDALLREARRRGSNPNSVRLTPTITYKDAFRLYRAENPVVGKKQAEEDAQRREIARPLAKANKSSGEAPKQQRPRLPRNASIDQIINAYGL